MCTLTIYFEDPFWVGVFERIEEGRLSVLRVTFGAEPKDYELWDFVLRRYNALRFSPAVEAPVKALSDNPKRPRARRFPAAAGTRRGHPLAAGAGGPARGTEAGAQASRQAAARGRSAASVRPEAAKTP